MNPVNHGSSPSGTHRVRMLTQSPPVNSSEEVRPRARFRFPFGGRSPAAEICGHYRNARRSLLAQLQKSVFFVAVTAVGFMFLRHFLCTIRWYVL